MIPEHIAKRKSKKGKEEKKGKMGEIGREGKGKEGKRREGKGRGGEGGKRKREEGGEREGKERKGNLAFANNMDGMRGGHAKCSKPKGGQSPDDLSSVMYKETKQGNTLHPTPTNFGHLLRTLELQ